MSDQCGKSKLPLPSEQGLPANSVLAGLGVWDKEDRGPSEPLRALTGDAGIDAVNSALHNGVKPLAPLHAARWPATVVDSNKSPYFYARRFMASYPGRVTREMLENHFTSETVFGEIKQAYVCIRRADPALFKRHIEAGVIKAGDTISHIAVDVGRRVQKKTPEFLAMPELGGPLMVRVASGQGKKQWQEILQFVEDSEDADHASGDSSALQQEGEQSLYEQVKACGSREVAMRTLVKKPMHFAGIKGMCDMIFVPKHHDPLAGKTLLPWQREMLLELQGEPDTRRIIWIDDYYGNSGKSALAMHLMATNPKDVFFLPDIGKYSDLATIMAGAVKEGWTGKILWVNLVRQAVDHKLYKALEGLRDAHMLATKYKGRVISWPPGWMVVGGNWLPDFNMLSKDRWDIRSLSTLEEKAFWAWYRQRQPEDYTEDPQEVNREAIRMYRITLPQAQARRRLRIVNQPSNASVMDTIAGAMSAR
jgi:hypothetical protein